MKLLARILVPTNFSPAAEDAVRMAAFVAKKFNSEICLLHALPETLNRKPNVQAMVMKKVRAHMEEIAAQIRAEGIQCVETVVDKGVPFDLINQRAVECDANVIIMGADKSPTGGLFRYKTTAAKFRRKATKPVWIVAPGAAPRVNNILCPVDCSESSGRALRNAIHLSRKFSARLTVLTVIQGLPENDQCGNEDVAGSEETSAQEQVPHFNQFLAHFDFHNVSWNKVVRYHEPYREILKVVRETKTDLLVMGSMGKTGFSQGLIGKVATDVAPEMPCSVFTVKAEHAIRLWLDTEDTDMEDQIKQGHELLEHGLSEEALGQFQHCMAKNTMDAPAWKGLAAAHQRLGHETEAENCTAKAESIVKQLEDSRIEADIRRSHPLFNRKR